MGTNNNYVNCTFVTSDSTSNPSEFSTHIHKNTHHIMRDVRAITFGTRQGRGFPWRTRKGSTGLHSGDDAPL